MAQARHEAGNTQEELEQLGILKAQLLQNTIEALSKRFRGQI